jgi:tetratricopeptide (TPR) repeat protein/SAM-dependent methyltransferase
VSFSIRNLFRGRGAEEPAPASDHRQAQDFVNRGIAAEASGAAAKALQYYRKAVEVDDAFGPAHVNLGIALQAAGDSAAAIASYERAIAVDPQYAAAHCNLALMHLQSLHYSQAEASFRTALRLRNNFPEAWVGLAGALEGLERLEDALSALEKAIALRTDYVGALRNSTALLRKMGRPEKAVASGRRVLELEPDNAFAQCDVGLSLHDLGRLEEAETAYRRALALQPDFLEAKANLALIVAARTGRTQEAIPLLFELVGNDPTNSQLRRSLAEVLRGVPLASADEKEREILLSLCMDDNVSMLYLNSAIMALLESDEGYASLRESTARGEDPFVSIDPAVAEFLRDLLFLTALPRMPITDVEVEEVFTHVRRCILLRLATASGSVTADAVVPAEFVCALARQCFFTGYAFFATEGELQRVASVRDGLQTALDGTIASLRTLESALAVAALYDSLHTLEGCDRLLEYPMADWSEAFRPIVTEQIENRRRERELAMQLTSITTIDDEVSVAVRAQYEENPYPRWVTVRSPEPDTIEKLAGRLRPGRAVRVRPRPVPVLIAGCGTGHHPIQVARAYADSEILAVDLSLASLGYAARMTKRFGVPNITYRQADILKLASLDRRFAIVECGGVLHHLDDPMAGWRALVSLLEPDGLMKIALYSEKARGAVRAAREFTRSLDIALTPEGIRQCRHAIMGLPEGHAARGVMAFNDFYTADECRDMVMHVQEHQFTLPRIANCLDRLGLQLLKLECSTAARARFMEMFPDRSADTNLAAWDEFEEAYPDTFTSMYAFWCCRK